MTEKHPTYDCSPIPLVVCFCFVFALLYSAIPLTPSAVMRSVPQRLKAFQMSVQLFLVRIFGTIPGPIIVGSLIDNACVAWQVREDGSRGQCFVYDNRGMVKAFSYFRELKLSIFSILNYPSNFNEIHRVHLLLHSRAHSAEEWEANKQNGKRCAVDYFWVCVLNELDKMSPINCTQS